MDENADVLGGGNLLAASSKLHDDFRLVSRAIKKRWPISDELKAGLIERLEKIIEENEDDEVAIKAINVIKGMEQQNQKDEQTAILQSDRNRFLDIAERLGLDKSSVGVTEARSGSDFKTIDGTAERI